MAMTGTTVSATVAIRRIPPKITAAAATSTTTPETASGTPHASLAAAAIELACTALNTRPKAISRANENATPIARLRRPRIM